MSQLTQLMDKIELLANNCTNDVINNGAIYSLGKEIREVLMNEVRLGWLKEVPHFVIEIDCKTEKVSVHFESEPEYKQYG